MTTVHENNQEIFESERLFESAFQLSRSLGGKKLLVKADALEEISALEALRKDEEIIWLTSDKERSGWPSADKVVVIPASPLTRFSQIKTGLFLALLNGCIEFEETVLCLSGLSGSERVDTLIICNPQRDFPWFQKHEIEKARSAIATREIGRILEIALRLSSEGREGKPLGTIFILGDMEKLKPYLKQLILNPCEGHSPGIRNIHNQEFFETIREYAALDGAFIVNYFGIVESAGTYLNAPLSRARLRPGQGARHAAAAGITENTDAIAVVLSESSGAVSVIHDGEIILDLWKDNLNSI